MASASSTSAATNRAAAAPPKLTCLCSPTNHAGSFRCSRHRNSPSGEAGGPHRAPARGRSVRALLLQRIASGPSDRGRRRGDFQPRPSRLRLMNK